MAEFTEKCEHCGSLNKRGALRCDTCGKAFPANVAAKYEEYTKKTRKYFTLFVVSVILAAALTVGMDVDPTLSFAFISILSFLDFLMMGTAMITLVFTVSTFFARNKYKHSENVEFKELSLAGSPEDKVQAGSDSIRCPSCGNRHSEKETRCKYCGYDLINKTGPAKSRLTDAELVESMDHYNKRGLKFIILSVPVLIIALITLEMAKEEISLLIIPGVILLIAFLVLFVMGISFLGTATKMFKVNVVRDALASIIDDCVYRPEKSISKDRIEDTYLVRSWNKFRGDDYIRGTYKGRQFEFSDIRLENEDTNSEDATVTVTVFRGHWIIYRLAKKLPAVVKLSEGTGKGVGKGNAETENVAFNKKYTIYTDDPHYMFYVLTPHFMDYIIAADEVADARTFFYFAGDMVHIAIDNGKNAFEEDSNDKKNPDMARERIKSEMKYITDILDELLLNEYLFGEEQGPGR